MIMTVMLSSSRLEANFRDLGAGTYGLGLGLIGLEGPGLGLGFGLESCIDSFLASPSNWNLKK